MPSNNTFALTPQNPLDTKNYPGKISGEIYSSPIYKDTDRQYLSFLQNRLERARRARQQQYPELKNKTYLQVFDENEKIANTVLAEKKNDDDVIVSAGTIESKLDTLLAHIGNLDLSVDIFPFDRENNIVDEVGTAIEDIIKMTEEKDGGDEGGDEEKKLLRQRELLKQGIVFVQEEWLRLFETKKILKRDFNGEFDFEDGWDEAIELVFEGPSRTLLYGPNVFLGDITEFFMEKQPYVFAVINQNYDVAQEKYGKFSNWKYVQKGKMPTLAVEEETSIYSNKWRLTDVKDEQVEIVLYQDKPRDEFQIIINGVLMLPVGFPLSAVCPGGNYNITKQVFRVLSHKFAYGGSFVGSGAVKEISALIDEMLKLFVLKTRKSYSPPYINTSGKVISSRVLSAGRISMGIPMNALHPIGNEGQGTTSNEFNIYKELQDRIDKSTVSNQFSGQQGHAGTTATEVVELQRQAKLTLGLTILSCSLLEKKLAYLRIWNILANWFNPVDKKFMVIQGARKEMNRFRNSYRKTNIEDEGTGARQIIPVEGEVPSPETIRALELRESREKGFPIRKIYINGEGLRSAKLRWHAVVNPRERETSAFYKLLFREELSDILTLMQLGSQPNLSGLEDKFAQVYNENKNKVFASNITPNINLAGVSAQASGERGSRPNVSGSPAGMNILAT